MDRFWADGFLRAVVMAAPWSGVVVAAKASAWNSWRRDTRLASTDNAREMGV